MSHMDDCESRGWIKVGAHTYRHHCGARVTKRGRLWTAHGVDGMTFTGQLTALQAMSCIEERDPFFWSCGKVAVMGNTGGVWFNQGYLAADRQDEVLVWYTGGDDAFPAFLVLVFERHLFEKAHCVRCLSPMTELKMRVLREFDGSGSSHHVYIGCGCGYPVWRLDAGSFGTAGRAMYVAEQSWRRKQRITAAGGAHTVREIEEVLALQENRCIYCNVRFARGIRPTKDHLLAIADGGTDWALNIIMACRFCNSRRCDIPFRTYCKLLSERQNERILTHLGKRLLALDLSSVPDEALMSFDEAIAYHDAKHRRFLDIQNESAIARRNANRNQLFPRTRSLILKRYVPGRTSGVGRIDREAVRICTVSTQYGNG